jgi:hypothetical protein
VRQVGTSEGCFLMFHLVWIKSTESLRVSTQIPAPPDNKVSTWLAATEPDESDDQVLIKALNSVLAVSPEELESTSNKYTAAINKAEQLTFKAPKSYSDSSDSCDTANFDSKTCRKRLAGLLSKYDQLDLVKYIDSLIANKTTWGNLTFDSSAESLFNDLQDDQYTASNILKQLKDKKSGLVNSDISLIMGALGAIRNATMQLDVYSDAVTNMLSAVKQDIPDVIFKSQTQLNALKGDVKKSLNSLSQTLMKATDTVSRYLDSKAPQIVKQIGDLLTPGMVHLQQQYSRVLDVSDLFDSIVNNKTVTVEKDIPQLLRQVQRNATQAASTVLDLLEDPLPEMAKNATVVLQNKTDAAMSKLLQYINGNKTNLVQAKIDSDQKSRLEYLQASSVTAFKQNLTQLAGFTRGMAVDMNRILTDFESNFNATQKLAQKGLKKTGFQFNLTFLDAVDLLNKTSESFSNVTQSFDSDWAGIERASQGDFDSLSDSFVNHLGSVSAAANADQADLNSQMQGQAAQTNSGIADSADLMSANINDVANYMQGNAQNLDSETQNLARAMQGKQQEFNATMQFLHDFLGSRLSASNGSLSDAIGSLSGVLGQLAQPKTIALAKPAVDPNAEVSNIAATADAEYSNIAKLTQQSQQITQQSMGKLQDQVSQQQSAIQDVMDNADLMAQALTASGSSASRLQAIQQRAADLTNSQMTSTQKLKAQVASLIAVARKSLSDLGSDLLTAFQTSSDAGIQLASGVADAQATTKSIRGNIQQISNDMTLRLQTITSKVLPTLLSALDDLGLATNTTTAIQLKEISDYQAEILAGFQSDLNSTVSAQESFLKDSYDSSKDLFTNTLNTDDTDIQGLLGQLRDLESGIKGQYDLLNSLISQAKSKISNFQASTLGDAFESQVSQAVDSVTSLMNSVNATTAFVPVDAAESKLSDSVSSSLSFLNNLPAVLTQKLKDGIKQQQIQQQSATGDMLKNLQIGQNRDMDFARVTATKEINAISNVYDVLLALAPIVNSTSLTSALNSDQSGLTDIKSSISTMQVYNAANDPNLAGVSDRVAGLVNTIGDNVGLTLASNSSAMAVSIYSHFGKTTDAVSALASGLGSIGDGVGSVSDSGESLSAAVARSASDTAAAVSTHLSAMQATQDVSVDGLKALISAYMAKQLIAQTAMDEAAVAASSQQADMEGVVALWSSMFQEALNFTESGFDGLTQVSSSVDNSTDFNVQSEQSSVQSTLDGFESRISDAVKKTEDFRTAQSPLIQQNVQGWRNLQDSYTQLNNSLSGNITQFDTEIEQISSDSASNGISGKFSDWMSSMRNAVGQDLLTMAQRKSSETTQV